MKCAKCRAEIKQEVKFIQVVTGRYDNSFSIVALGDDGRVYRYSYDAQAWKPLPMEVAE